MIEQTIFRFNKMNMNYIKKIYIIVKFVFLIITENKDIHINSVCLYVFGKM